MDTQITLVTPAMQRQRGADAFAAGKAIDSHNMNPRAPGLKDWTLGFMQAQYNERLAMNPGIQEAADCIMRAKSRSAQP